MLTICINLISVVIFSFSVQAKESLFEKAVSAYDREIYEESIGYYQELIASGQASGHIYYNLGNAYFRDKQLGAAMASFLAARRLIPRDPDVRANLEFTQSKIKDKLEIKKESSFFRAMTFWVDQMTANELLNIACFLFSLGFLLLVITKKIPRLKELKVVSWSVVFLSMFVFVAYRISLFQDELWGAVVKNSIEVRSSPGSSGTLMFKLHEGAPFLLKTEEENWVKILLSDRKKGWVRKKDVLFFR